MKNLKKAKNIKYDKHICVNDLYQKRTSTNGNWELTEFIDNSRTRKKFNDHLSFQREHVWDKKMQIGLIDSLMRGRHVNAIILSRKYYENIEELRIIDGKQRFTTIRNFINGNLKIPFKIGDSIKELSYVDLIEEKRMPMCHVDINDILSHINTSVRMNVCIYDDLDTDKKEYDEFLRQNTAKNFNSNEKTFCYRPKTKHIFSKIWKYYVPDYFRKKVVKDDPSKESINNTSRYSGIRWFSYIFHYYCNLDLNFNISYDTTDVVKNDSIFLDKLESIFDLCKYIDIENERMDEKRDKDYIDIILNDILIKDHKLIDIVKLIKNDLVILEKILKNFKKPLKQRTMDYIIYLRWLKENQQETDSTITNDLLFWSELFSKFEDDKKIKNNEINATIRGKYMKQRFDLLNEYYINLSKEKNRDLGLKDKVFPQEVIDFLKICIIKYNWKCPYYSNENNFEINHYPPKSKSSLCYPIAISKKANDELKNYTIERKTTDFSIMIEYAKKCYEDIKNEIPESIKNYFDLSILDKKDQ